MRVMAIDYGSKAIGVAISDELRLTVRPLTTLRRNKQSRNQIIAQLQNLIQEHEVAELVVGLPLSLDGSFGDAAERVRIFIVELKKIISIPIIEQDERLTSREAEEVMRELGFDMRKRKEKSDEYAAAIILQDYLGR
jgi:putative holliday junction resolvase